MKVISSDNGIYFNSQERYITTEFIQHFKKTTLLFIESVILFLAAGENSGGDPLDVIKAKNEALNNSVTILAYSFGKGKYTI